MSLPNLMDAAIQRAARALADRFAEVLHVNKDDYWATYYGASIDDAKTALSAAGILSPEQQIGKILHYPGCWDTVAYPTLDDALGELERFTCQENHVEDVVRRTFELIKDAQEADMVVRIEVAMLGDLKTGSGTMVPNFQPARHSERLDYSDGGKHYNLDVMYDKGVAEAIQRGLLAQAEYGTVIYRA